MSTALDAVPFAPRVDAVEEAYEFFLSYAAKGVDARHASADDSGARMMLGRLLAALDGIEDAANELADGRTHAADWIAVLADDARKTRAALKLIEAMPLISSKVIDNLNASIHLRAVLTDLFVLDEAMKVPVERV